MLESNLKNMSLDQLKQWLINNSISKVHAKSVFQWLYREEKKTGTEVESLPLRLHQFLSEHPPGLSLNLQQRINSQDGSQKFVFLSSRGKFETVWIPFKNRITLCVSSQVGCALDCGFCLTGLLPFKGNLEPWEMVDQLLQTQNLMGQKVTNVVFMGMGEPLLNFENAKRAVEILTCPYGLSIAKSKITVSTAGYIPGILRWGREVGTNLAVSVIAASHEKRNRLMPINAQFPLDALVRAIHEYTLITRKKVFCEYLLIDGLTDSFQDAKALAKWFKKMNVTINLIPYNENHQFNYKRPPKERVDQFKSWLHEEGILSTVRWSHGSDIGAACGQLSGYGNYYRKEGILDS
ncbi:MAG: 23S rRNA (adenine(2503)-C(2))-methyltransferase RlmN [Bdellovibrionales bacterium]|nr:23S rRNA (adenine(2503)-C(2))-methyltransferase RlmN [Bdellovibrionales bacterium]